MLSLIYKLFTKAINSNSVTGVLFAVNISMFFLYVGAIFYTNKQRTVIEDLVLEMDKKDHAISLKNKDLENIGVFHSREILLLQKELDYCKIKLDKK